MKAFVCTLKFLAALSQVESGNNPRAIGDNGLAVGRYQIHAGVIADVNRHWKTSYVWPVDVYGPKKDDIARAIVCRYLTIYCTDKRLGRAPTEQDAARIWNGGPNGWRWHSTKKYWDRVREVLEGSKAVAENSLSPVPCPRCEGSGNYSGAGVSAECAWCSGSGYSRITLDTAR